MYKSIIKNSSYLLLAQFFVKFLAFFYTLFLAKSLGVDNFGLYIVALSYFSLISAVADFGISRYLTREIAVDSQSGLNLIANIISLRVGLLVVSMIVFGLISLVFDPIKTRALLELLAVVAILPQAVALTFDNLFIAVSKVSFSALGNLVLSIVNIGLGFFLIKQGLSIWGVILALLMAELSYAVFNYYLALKLNLNWSSQINRFQVKTILIGSLPYGFLAIIGLIYFKIDSILLSYFKGSYQTGIYGISYRFLEAVVFVPTSIGTVFFPSLAKLHRSDVSEIKKASWKIFMLMGLLGLGTCLIYLTLLPEIIRIFLPEFLPAIISIQILALAIPFMFIHVPLSQVLLSSDKYLKPVIFLSITNVLFNVVLNLIFIPKFGYLGASWVTVLSDVFSLMTLSFVMLRLLKK